MDAISYELPWPPSVNALWRMGRGKWYMTKEAKNYKDAVYYIVTLLKAPNFDSKQRLSLTILAYPPDKRKRDIDNLVKIVGDSLQAAKVFEDDSQIDRLLVERKEVRKEGRIEVLLEVIG